MTTQTLIKQLDREVSLLRQDTEVIKRILLAAYRDPEGEYKKSFIKKILSRAKEKPRYRFTTGEAFLKHVREGKK